jgi:hypothetical protein
MFMRIELQEFPGGSKMHPREPEETLNTRCPTRKFKHVREEMHLFPIRFGPTLRARSASLAGYKVIGAGLDSKRGHRHIGWNFNQSIHSNYSQAFE